MPRRDCTGPMESRNGRGMGFCNSTKDVDVIGNLGCRRDFRRNSFNNTNNSENQKDLLTEQKAILQKKLDLVNNQLNALQDDK